MQQTQIADQVAPRGGPRLMGPILVLTLMTLGFASCAPDDISPSPTPTAAPTPEPTPAPTPWPPLTEALTPIDAGRFNVALVLVHPDVAEGLRPELAALEKDLRREGWDPEVQVGSTDPETLRGFLGASHLQGPLNAVFIVGDIPYARCQGQFYDDVGACDLFLMDLDGEWQDRDGDGAYDAHAAGAAGNRGPEIAVGRLLGANVSLFGKTEIEMYQDYFARNHAYRRGQPATPRRSLYSTIWDHHYGEVDPISALDSWKVLDAQALVFPDTLALIYDARLDPAPAELWPYSDPEDKRTGLAKEMFAEQLGGGLDYISVGGHGWPQGWESLADVDDVASLVGQGQQLPVLIDSCGCQTAAIQNDDSLAAVTTMGGALAFVGPSIVATGFPDWDVAFRRALVDQAVGQALMCYHNTAVRGLGEVNLKRDSSSSNRILVGDPTLRLIR
jgi:hypothetical protein